MPNSHPTSEHAFEDTIVTTLLEQGGYQLGSNDNWSRELALDRSTLFTFIKESQPDQWQRLSEIHGSEVDIRFLQRLVKELDNRGTLDVLRHGIIDYGVRFNLAYFKPASGLNPETQRLYDLNQLKVIRQLRYSQKNERDAIDLVLCINGLPVATAEIKNAFTGQSVEQGREQFMKDRDPRELLFSFKKRALVHFVVDTEEVWMTTRLNGRETNYLPFNKGDGHAAGNPLNPRGHRTAYLWEEIWVKDSWMEILGNFVHLQQDEVNFGERKIKRETLIFPRYHQLDVVRKLKAAARQDGAGHNYLIQHSAGSGKSNSIAWLAHGLASLHNDSDQPVFSSVVVISDRRVLDRQLQDTIYQFEHRQGVVVRIDKDSDQLAQALIAGAKIIITTLQKFPFVLDKIDTLGQRQYAVIVDEAHSSQTGEASDALKMVLDGRSTYDKKPNEKANEEEWDYQDEIVRVLDARRARQTNISFFAFTATPKYKTLMAFGTPGPDGKPVAWHLYSMKQAIQEGFILDILKGYTTYKIFFRLSKQIEQDPRVNKKQAKRAIARFIRLHPHNLSQKVEVIVEHFRTMVMSRIGGQAKAMIVTSSRLDAVRYKQEVDRYLKEKGYSDIKALVAFSGTVEDDLGMEYTEASMNGFGEKELPDRFWGAEYRLLLVAEKYQTGFDQPLLHTMYIDKKLAGVHAVQTLSRINRIYPGKEDTFILDFVNEPEEIQKAFQPFYEGTTIEKEPDPNKLYDFKTKLDSFQITLDKDIENFASIFFQPNAQRSPLASMQLNSLIDPAVDRWRSKTPDERDEYKHFLLEFIRLYSFMSQVMPFADVELEKFYAYSRLLITKIQENDLGSCFQVGDQIALEYYRLQKITEGSIFLESKGDIALQAPSELTGSTKLEEEQLSTIIEYINERFGTDFTAADQLFFDQIEEDLMSDENLSQQARNNSIENFRYPFNDVFIDKVIGRMEQNQEITDRIMNEDEFADLVKDLLLRKVYRKLTT
jgi:type I restriction enzyme R subunit